MQTSRSPQPRKAATPRAIHEVTKASQDTQVRNVMPKTGRPADLTSTNRSLKWNEHRTQGLIAATLIALHFQVVAIGGYPITIALALSPLLVASNVFPLIHRNVIAAISALCCLFSLIALFDQQNDDIQYAKTFTVALVSIVIVAIFASSPLRSNPNHRRPYLWVLASISGISWLQWIAGGTGNKFFFNPWRGNQYLYQYVPHLEFPPIRAEAFYLEPSFAALVVVGCLTCAILCDAPRLPTSILAYSALVPIGSASGMISLLLVQSVLLITPIKRRTRSAARVLGQISALFVFTIALLQFVPYLERRLGTTSQAGSSANFRLLAPTGFLVDAISDSPLGKPLGSVNRAVYAAGLANGTTRGSSLDNGWYVLIYYTGCLGLVAILALAIHYVSKLVHAHHSTDGASPLTGMTLLVIPFFTGAVLTPEVGIVFSLIILEHRRNRSRNNSRAERDQNHEGIAQP
jgi:putative colanic acid polymerase